MKFIRHPVTLALLGVGAVAFAVAMYLFQPWRLFTTVEVNEALPTVPSAAGDRTAAAASDTPAQQPASESPRKIEEIASGRLVTHEHTTTGTARVLRLPDGSRVLRLENLKTSDGPDLRVWLSDQPVTKSWFNFDDGRYLELGHLKGNKGNANYPIPANADLDTLTSVTIWCKRFSVSFGAAALR
ncbi:DM13 domain-containing protein [Thermoactinospora rubra]|uniref:DM13 domain-containing protein n=1 Tax=Thermoactinospora rubra TaxID=1088767 RepID=UPI000A0FA2A8|nr:DM13 domain-containing protein [Thermoactinospora rubra]